MCAQSIVALYREMRKYFHLKRRKRSSAEKSPPDPPKQNPRVPRGQCLIVHGLNCHRKPVTTLTNQQNSSNILKTHRLGPRVANSLTHLTLWKWSFPRQLCGIFLWNPASISLAHTRAFIFMSTTPEGTTETGRGSPGTQSALSERGERINHTRP